MNADGLALCGSKAIKNLIVEVDEAAQQSAGRVKLEGQSGFREVNLYRSCTRIEGTPDVDLGLIDEIRYECFAWIVW